MRIEFLSFADCPQAPILRQRLDEALRALGVTATPDTLDLEQLCQAGDRRSGFGSPTILVDGNDLFGMESPLVAERPACRLYHPTVPSIETLIERLRERITESR